MFILSQDKKKLAEYKKIYVSEEYKSKRASLLEVGTGIVIFSEGAVVLGEYETQEEAITELERICEAMSNGVIAYTIHQQAK